MKVIIAEAGSAHNIGSMALIENAINIVRKKHGNCEIVVLSSDPLPTYRTLKIDNLDQNVVVKDDLFIFPKGGVIKKMFWLFITFLWILYTRCILLFSSNLSHFIIGRRKKLLLDIEQAEYIYCIGAERINDVYYKTALLSLYALGTYIKMRKKIIHLSLTIGPVFYKSTIMVAKRILNKSYAIFVRDQKSYDLLIKWGIKAPYKFNAYDIALLQNIDKNKSEKLLNEFHVKPGFIGVSVLYWHFRKAIGPARMPEYYKAFADALDYLVLKYNVDILMTPTVIGDSYHQSDDITGDEIIKMMKYSNRVVNIHRLLTPVELSTLYTHCKFSIVTRMHSAILCSGAGGHPVIAVNYLYKLREYMKNIGFEDYSVDIDYINSKDLKGFIDKMMENYDYNISKLRKRQVEMQNKLINYLSQI